MLQPVSSVTHAHLNYAIAAEVGRGKDRAPLDVLDVGCGNGQLLLALHRHLPGLIDRPVSLSGFDVDDSRVQRSDFFHRTIDLLERDAPGMDWKGALSQVGTKSPWPYNDGSFDVVVSNQVLEHVSDIDFFIDQTRRVLRPGGVSINLFPVRAVIMEGHVGTPYAHRIASDDVRRAYLTQFARLGLSRVGPMRRGVGQGAEEFGSTRAEYVATQTAYNSFRELSRAAHKQGLTCNYRWTPQFYLLKLGYILGKDVSKVYRRGGWSLPLEMLSFPALSRISGVTVVFSNLATYDPDSANGGHLGKGRIGAKAS